LESLVDVRGDVDLVFRALMRTHFGYTSSHSAEGFGGIEINESESPAREQTSKHPSQNRIRSIGSSQLPAREIAGPLLMKKTARAFPVIEIKPHPNGWKVFEAEVGFWIRAANNAVYKTGSVYTIFFSFGKSARQADTPLPGTIFMELQL
jgi:hypothetical protein